MFCQVVVVYDYHDIQSIANSFPSMKLNCDELGTCTKNGVKQYVGLLYEGCISPGPREIADLLLEAKVVID